MKIKNTSSTAHARSSIRRSFAIAGAVFLAIGILLLSPAQAIDPVASRVSPEARSVLQYLSECTGTKTLTGVHDLNMDWGKIQWGRTYASNYILNKTGVYPAIRSFEF